MRILFILLCIVGAVYGRASVTERVGRVMKKLEMMMETNTTLAEIWQEHLNQFQDNHERRAAPSSFNCQTFSSSSNPSNVHQLRASDIKVIGALGDSLTSGNGILATNVLQVIVNYRGRAWSVGGDLNIDQGVITIPNILKKYNSRITGWATGYGIRDGPGANLNVAHEGDTSYNMPEQAHMLIDRIRAMSDVDFYNDWKMVTLFIGGNDLCDMCDDPTGHAPAVYISKIKEALDILHGGLPRAFVNLVEIFDLTPLTQMNGGFVCDLVQDMVCDCARDPANVAMLQQTAADYQKESQKLVASGRYDRDDDFTVILQPFLRETDVPRHSNGEPDLSYFSPDCFHFSEKGQQVVALSQWNNMWQPVGQKSTSWFNNQPYTCPRSNDYLRTAFN